MKRLVGGLVLLLLAVACAAIWGASTSPELVSSFSKAYASWIATPTPDFLLTSTPTPTACPQFQVPTPVVYGDPLPPWRDVEAEMYKVTNSKINCRNYSGKEALATFVDGVKGKSVNGWQGRVDDVSPYGDTLDISLALDSSSPIADTSYATPLPTPAAPQRFHLLSMGAHIFGLDRDSVATGTPIAPGLTELKIMLMLRSIPYYERIRLQVGNQIAFSGVISPDAGKYPIDNHWLLVIERPTYTITGQYAPLPGLYAPVETATLDPTPTDEPTATHGIPPTPPSDLSRMVVTLRSEGCNGTCPNYLVTIRGDGTVTYEGYEHVKTAGTITSTVPLGQVRDLAKAISDADFFSLDNSYYEAGPTDQPVIISSVTFGDDTKLVGHYLGANSIPSGLSYVEEMIGELADVDRLVLFGPDETRTLPKESKQKPNRSAIWFLFAFFYFYSSDIFIQPCLSA